MRMDEFADQRRLIHEHLVEAAPQIRFDAVCSANQFDRHVPVSEWIASQIDPAGATACNFADHGVFADLRRQRFVHVLALTLVSARTELSYPAVLRAAR